MNGFEIPPKFEENGWRLTHSPDGKLCQLDQMNGFRVWMGNGYREDYDMSFGAMKMNGHCLVLGLGIGLIVQYIDYYKKCESVTIIENSPTVIKHIGPWLKSVVDIPVEIIESDDIEFLKNTDRKWDTMYADTWEKCIDALKKIEILKTLAKPKIRGKKIYWCEQELKKIKKRGY